MKSLCRNTVLKCWAKASARDEILIHFLKEVAILKEEPVLKEVAITKGNGNTEGSANTEKSDNTIVRSLLGALGLGGRRRRKSLF